jgi:hypothetical protein
MQCQVTTQPQQMLRTGTWQCRKWSRAMRTVWWVQVRWITLQMVVNYMQYVRLFIELKLMVYGSKIGYFDA